ncbi:RAMP superfamily CRISPR-associated protein [Thermoanaerobacterium saccharolyticum]|uniref:RAMP superfamily CRISPR-associated protein n=1 Tax=Thermoanaerobacterium saccharolyticum TaxID=28896 RepID=UPI002FD9457B
MEKINIKVETVAPLYTGNAFGNMSEIEPQSIIGSLRFWFETYLKAAKIDIDYDYKSGEVNAEDYRKSILKFVNNGMSLKNAKIKSMSKLQWPSLIFGCNGLKGLIEIDKINFNSSDIGNALNLPFAIYKKKNEQNFIEIKTKRDHDKIKQDLSQKHEIRNYHFWYFPNKYFVGTFDVIFKIEDNDTTEKIFYPLLNFIENYGYLGGKNNLGFGRVKFSLENKTLNSFDNFDFSAYTTDNNLLNINNVIENIKEIKDLYTIDKIGLYKITDNLLKNTNEIIKELLAQKAQERIDFRKYDDKDLRHYIFGAISTRGGDEDTNATKIIPWINKTNDNNYEYGFISVIFLDENKLSKIKEKVNPNG